MFTDNELKSIHSLLRRVPLEGLDEARMVVGIATKIEEKLAPKPVPPEDKQ